MSQAPLILTIDTATATTVVGLMDGHQLIASQSSNDKRRADNLLMLIDEVLASAGRPLTELTLVAVRRGIGSYTGLRVGVTVANTLGWSLDVPVIGVVSRRLLPLKPEILAARAARSTKRQPDGWRQVIPLYATWQTPQPFAKMGPN